MRLGITNIHWGAQDGRPVYIEQLGKLDLTKLFTVTTPERQIQRLVVEYEKFLRQRLPVCTAMRDDNAVVDTSCTIMDLAGVGVSQFWKVKNFVQEASTISQNYYPGHPSLLTPYRTELKADRRDYGQVLHYQRPLPLCYRLELCQALAGPRTEDISTMVTSCLTAALS